MSNVSIGGRGGNPVSDLALVNVDNVTIFGNGATEPLSAAPAAQGLVPWTNSGFGPSLALGKAVVPNTVHADDIALAKLAGTTLTLPAGLIAKLTADGGFYQTSGALVLTTGEWDAVTGGSGGLTPGVTYYTDAATVGHLSAVPYGAQVGIAIDATTMLIQIADGPPTIVLPLAGSALPGQTLVVEDSSGAKLRLGVNVSAAPHNFTGLAIASSGGSIVCQYAGIVDLAIALWDAIIDGGSSTGLTPGESYYMSVIADGNIVTPAPAATNNYAVLVGFALSTTQMLLQPGTPVGPHA